MQFRVASYNIAKGVTPLARRVRLHDVRMALHTLDADIACLQEVQDKNERLARVRSNYPDARPLDLLASAGFSHAVYGANKHYGHGHHGNAVLSRWPIDTHENVDISVRSVERRGALVTCLRVHGTTLHLVSTHFSLLARDRAMQAEALTVYLRHRVRDDEPLVIAGDFNDWHGRVDALLRHSLGVKEVFDAAPTRLARTFPSFFPMLRLDRIYVRGLHVRQARVQGGLAWARHSDHVPIVAELLLPEAGK